MSARAPAPVPVFTLYGEEEDHDPGLMHIEDIRARSERYGWEIQPHRHEGLFQTLVLLDGEAQFLSGSETRTVRGPCALTIPPGLVHAFRFTPQSHGHVLTLAEAGLMRSPPLREDPRLHAFLLEPRQIDLTHAPDTAERLEPLLRLIGAEMNDSLAGSRLMLDGLIAAVLVLLWRQGEANALERSEPGRRGEQFRAFRALIDKHLFEHWPVQRYAEVLGLTERQLHRLCRAHSGKSPLDIVQDRLVLEAQRKLIHIAAPVALLAYELGFEDPAYFWRFFKRRVGLTPSAYRDRERARVLAEAGYSKDENTSRSV